MDRLIAQLVACVSAEAFSENAMRGSGAAMAGGPFCFPIDRFVSIAHSGGQGHGQWPKGAWHGE